MIISVWIFYMVARRYGFKLAKNMGNSCTCLKKQQTNNSVRNNESGNREICVVTSNRTMVTHTTGSHQGPSGSAQPRDANANGMHVRLHQRKRDKSEIDRLVKDTLSLIRILVDNDQEPPRAMMALHRLADKEAGWLAVVNSMIRVIPHDDPLGPAVITLLLDECPLPSKEAIAHLCKNLKLSKCSPVEINKDVCKHRNICVVLGCLAEKMAGPSSVSLLIDDILSYLLGNMDKSVEPTVILHSLVALEKFAQTSENKGTINSKLKADGNNPIRTLEDWRNSESFPRREVGFCATWLLDNLFMHNDRMFSYEKEDNSKLNVMLNSNDVSEYLKISPNGLEARCDASSFESVRCTFQVDSGIWYYEGLIITTGVMQIGYATKDSKFLNYEGYGIGDDEYSVAYDGCRQLLWYNAKSESHSQPRWKPGDTLGLLLDLENGEVVFSLNGKCLPPHKYEFLTARSGFFAAASFMSFQQCEFNFGHKPFLYPPNVPFSKFNDHGFLSQEARVILPRHKKVYLLQQVPVSEDSCTICCEYQANTTLYPCEHRGLCMTCAMQMETCPMCREPISDRMEDT